MIEAIRFIMEFYNVSEQDAILYYWDEIEAYMNLMSLKYFGVNNA